MLQRAISTWIELENSSITDPMIFLSGPRQVGKTFWAKPKSPRYFNWDTPEVKDSYLKDKYFFREYSKHHWVIFDEIHKRKDWKNLIKGYYDSPKRTENFIVTGSGRFDTYQKGGDSIQGRYFNYQLWPLAYDEIYNNNKSQANHPRDFTSWEPDLNPQNDEELIRLGGFPAPFIKSSEFFLKRWQNQYLERLVREDILDFSLVQKLDKMELLARLLPDRCGSPLSEKALAEDLEVSPIAIKSWLNLFEKLFFGFSVRPFHRKIHRAVKKERKWYFYQWTYQKDPALRFENYIAVQLATACAAWTEQGYDLWELFYLRDQDRREVDFLICKDLTPIALIEVKSSPQNWTNSLHFYSEKLNIPGFLIHPKGQTKKIPEKGYIMPSGSFLKNLILS